MTSLYLLQACLVLHITGLAVMAGTTFSNFVALNKFWKHYAQDKQKGLIAVNTLSGFPRLIGIGAAVLVLSGIGMMTITHGVFGEQLWFRIKIGLVVILIVNGIFVARPQGIKLRKLIADVQTNNAPQIETIKRRLSLFHIIQFTLFIIVFTLSVFKFN